MAETIDLQGRIATLETNKIVIALMQCLENKKLVTEEEIASELEKLNLDSSNESNKSIQTYKFMAKLQEVSESSDPLSEEDETYIREYYKENVPDESVDTLIERIRVRKQTVQVNEQLASIFKLGDDK